MRAHAFALLVVLAPWLGDTASDTIRVKGLQKPVDILVDRWGVPHIYAASHDDLFFAQGFNAARDRLVQLDLWRRRGLGQLAEVFGDAYVEQDRAARLFLYRGDMRREWLAYGDHAKRVASSFAAGINAYIDYVAAHPDRMPIEFRRLNVAPAKWTPEDVVRIRTHGLTRNVTSEVARARTACASRLEDDRIRVGLQPPWTPQVPEGLDVCLPADMLRVFRLATQAVRVPRESADEPASGDAGSNNWVIGPSRSATGRAILANDPHRAYSAPSLRYLAHLNAPGIDVIGAGEPAAPGISLGHNGAIAFGLTIFPIDQEDLYVYELNAANPDEYRYRDRWEPMQVVREEIRIKDASPVTVELKFTRHGPVIHVDRTNRRAFAVRSAWMEPGMSPYLASLGYMRARDWDQFLAAIDRWGAPTLNHVFADTAGRIGWAVGGLAPIRRNWDGLLPVPGDGRYEWDGFRDRDELPSVFNPAEGWFATANQMNLPAGYPYQERKLGFEWANRSRYARIREVLAARPKVSLEDSMRLQNDLLSIPARRLVALLKPLTSSDPNTRTALDLLRRWDAVEHARSAPAALMEVWVARHLSGAVKKRVLPPPAAAAITTPDLAVALDMLERPDAIFGPDPARARDALLLETLAAAFAEMTRLQGPDPAAWQWGRLHHNLAPHPLAGAVGEPLRSALTVGPFPTGGSAYVPNQSGYRVRDFRQTGGPSVRIVIDVGGWDNSWAVNHPGQSGDPESPHYRDLAELWLAGKYFPLRYTRAAVEKDTKQRIRLVP